MTKDDNFMYKDGIAWGLWAVQLLTGGLVAGLHRIYLGKYGTGILYFFTFGLAGVGTIVDAFRMRQLVLEANIGAGHLPHPRVAERLVSAETSAPKLESGIPTLRQRLVEAALAHGGAISVTQGVAETGLTFEEVEHELRELVATGYVDVDNAPHTGVVIYRFTELG